MKNTLLSLLVFLLNAGLAQAQDTEDLVKASIVYEQATPGTQALLRIGVLFQVEEGWHIYWENSGQAGLPTTVSWSTPSNFESANTRYPAPTKFLEGGDITTYGYAKELLVISDLFVTSVGSVVPEEIALKADLSWLVCKDKCVPGRTSVSKTINRNHTGPNSKLFEHYDSLTPQPNSEANRYGLALKANQIPSEEANTDGNSYAQVIVSVEGLTSSSANLPSKNLQIFDRHNANFEFVDSYLLPKNTKDDETPRADILMRFKRTTEVPLSDISASGIMVISPLVSPAGREMVLAWSTSPRDPSTDATTYTAGISPEAFKNAAPLSYRFIDKGHPEETQGTSLNPSSNPISHVTQSSVTLLGALLLGFLGGILLNLMPCVLPIVSIKVLSFVGHANEPKHVVLRNAFFFSIGILLSMLALAVSVIAMRSIGEGMGWGFQFQHPEFVLALLFIVVLLALSLFDVFTLSLPFVGSISPGRKAFSKGAGKHIFDGVLTTALATPCTAPFLGTALAFAFAQPPSVVIAVFISTGLGLCLPYVLVSTNRRLVNLLPAPGHWMITFRHIMGFVLLGTGIWLLFVLNKLVGGTSSLWALVGLTVVWVSIWAERKAALRFREVNGLLLRLLILIAASFLLVRLFPMMTLVETCTEPMKNYGPINWVPFESRFIENQRESKQILFIDFTAQWCITCKANEHLVIETQEVAKAIRDNNVLALKADWTSGSKEVTQALQHFGGGGVPYYVVLSPGGRDVQVLPSILTKSMLIESIARANNRLNFRGQ